MSKELYYIIDTADCEAAEYNTLNEALAGARTLANEGLEVIVYKAIGRVVGESSDYSFLPIL